MHGTSTLAIIVIAVLCVATTAHAYQGPDLHAVTPSLPADWTAHDLSQRRVALADRSNDPSANTLRALGSSISGSSAGLVTELRFLGEAPRVVVIDANGVASYVDSSGNTGSSSEPVSVPGPPPGAIASSSTGATLDTVSDPPSPVSEPVETKPVETKPVEAESVEPSPPPNDNPVEPTPSPSPPPLPPTALNATIERERSTTITVEPTIFCTEDAAFDNSSCPGPETIAAQISVLNDVFNKYDFAFKLGETRYVRNDTVAGERFLEPAYELTALGMEWISSNHRGDRSSMNLMIKERGIGGMYKHHDVLSHFQRSRCS